MPRERHPDRARRNDPQQHASDGNEQHLLAHHRRRGNYRLAGPSQWDHLGGHIYFGGRRRERCWQLQYLHHPGIAADHRRRIARDGDSDQGLPLSWTGGNSTDAVEIIGYAGTNVTTGTTTVTNATEFICTTTAGTGGFTVPASVLNQLPQVLATTANGSRILEVASGPAPVTFSPSLTAGGTVASTFSALIATAASTYYQ